MGLLKQLQIDTWQKIIRPREEFLWIRETFLWVNEIFVDLKKFSLIKEIYLFTLKHEIFVVKTDKVMHLLIKLLKYWTMIDTDSDYFSTQKLTKWCLWKYNFFKMVFYLLNTKFLEAIFKTRPRSVLNLISFD